MRKLITLCEKIVYRDNIRLNPTDYLDTVIAVNPTKTEFYSRHFTQRVDTPSAAGVTLKTGEIIIGEGNALSHEDICNYANYDIDDEKYRLQIYNNGVGIEIWIPEEYEIDHNSSEEDHKKVILEFTGNTTDQIISEVKQKTAFTNGYSVYIMAWTNDTKFIRIN